MGKREARNAENEAIALSEVTDEWMSAIEISMRLGMKDKWRIVACALRRLVDKGEVEMMIRKVEGRRRVTEDQAVYRVQGMARGLLPAWLAPQIPEVRILKRRIFRCK